MSSSVLTRGQAWRQEAVMDEARIYRGFGQRLAALRTELQMTQAELAQRVQLSRASIANIERGEQRFLLHYAYTLAAALGLRDVRDLLPLDVEEELKEEAVDMAINIDEPEEGLSDVERRQVELIFKEIS